MKKIQLKTTGKKKSVPILDTDIWAFSAGLWLSQFNSSPKAALFKKKISHFLQGALQSISNQLISDNCVQF